MISLSNLLKQCFVMNSEQGMRIIDSNQQAEALLKKHLTEETEQPFVQAVEENVPQEQAEFESGIPAEEIDLEEIRKEAIANAQAEADQIVQSAKEEAESLRQNVQAEVSALFEEQKRLGYEEGAKVREEELQKESESLRSEYAMKEQALTDNYERKLAGMERDIVDAVTEVFEKVFQIQFEDKREILQTLVMNTIMDVDIGDKIRIYVNDSDREMLQEHFDEIQDCAGQDVLVEFMHDKSLVDGQCRIETAYGVFDCGIDAQLSNLLKDIRSLV